MTVSLDVHSDDVRGHDGANRHRAIAASLAIAVCPPAQASAAIDDAVAQIRAPRSGATVAPAAPRAVSTVTYAWIAGHWAPRGSGFEWVPPDPVGRLVVERTWVPEGWVWRSSHYACVQRIGKTEASNNRLRVQSTSILAVEYH